MPSSNVSPAIAELYEQRRIAAHDYHTTSDVRRRIIAHQVMGWIDEQITITRIREMRESCSEKREVML